MSALRPRAVRALASPCPFLTTVFLALVMRRNQPVGFLFIFVVSSVLLYGATKNRFGRAFNGRFENPAASQPFRSLPFPKRPFRAIRKLAFSIQVKYLSFR